LTEGAIRHSEQVNILEIKKGHTFGGHYHKTRTEFFLIIKGALELNGKEMLNEYDWVIIEPGDMHTFYAWKPTIAIELLSEPFDEKDTWK
jgi:quercetin dioxygenase-like cupin family protein